MDEAERIRQMQAQGDELVPVAIRAAIDIATDPKHKDRIKVRADLKRRFLKISDAQLVSGLTPEERRQFEALLIELGAV